MEKYKKIREQKIKKYGNCDTILIRKFLSKETVFLLQNMFPVIEKYIDHVHIINGKEAKVIDGVAKDIEKAVNKLMKLVAIGKKVIFTDIENDMKIMLEELKKLS